MTICEEHIQVRDANCSACTQEWEEQKKIQPLTEEQEKNYIEEGGQLCR